MIHLVDQIFILGPMYIHHMYPYKRHMVVMNGYVCNHAHPEGSMIKGYTTEEVIECSVDYIKDGKPLDVLVCDRTTSEMKGPSSRIQIG
jgi:hypothetical protein